MNRILNKIQALLQNSVVKNILLVGTITLLIKGIGFYKETQIAANYGLSIVLDTFFIAYLIPGFVQSVFLESFKSVFIPNYIAELKSGNDISRFQGLGFFTTALMALFFTIIAILITDVYLQVFFSGKEVTYYELIKDQFYIVLPCIFLWGFSSLLSGLLTINEEFRHSSFESIFIPVSIIICIFFFKDKLGNMLLAIGSLIGSILSFLYLIIVCWQKNILNLSLPDFNNQNSIQMFKQIPAKITSSIFAGLHNVVDQFFAVQLAIGSISALNYALKIPAFAIGIIVIAMNNDLLPHFSKLVLKNKDQAYQQLYKLLKIVFLGSAIIAIIGILTSDFFISLFFERNEFTNEDTKLVSNLQKIILLYIPFKISGMLLVNFLTSINKNNFMAIVSLISVVLNIILNFALVNHFGIFGIVTATTTVVIIRNLILLRFTIIQKNKFYIN
ncbi:MAG: lipid II flippase MurJ [Flavobacteriaceae bacterium]